MHALVTGLLASGANLDYTRLLFIRHALLSDTLRAAGIHGAVVADQLEDGLAPLAKLTAQDTITNGTPFFWMNVHRCYAAILEDECALAGYARHLLMSAFDAFFTDFPEGSAVVLPVLDGADIVLPKLGVAAPGSDQKTTLRRTGSTLLEIETESRTLRLDLRDLAPNFRLPTLPICGPASARLLPVSDPALFEAEYCDKVAPVTPNTPLLAEMIGRSLGLIETVDAELGARMARGVRWYVPIHNEDVRFTHNSFTAANLNGVMFLSEAYNDLRLAEAMVHEFHHMELNVLMETQSLFETREDDRLYSPWRNDPRPLFGLLHGIYVFSGVAAFYRRAETIESPQISVAGFRERRQAICHQLSVALAQVCDDRLTPLGRRLVEEMETDLHQHEIDLDCSGKPLPASMREHFQAWCGRNVELAKYATMPV